MVDEPARDSNSDAEPGNDAVTIGGFDTAGRIWVLCMFGFGGLAVGVVLPYLAQWVADLPWAPFQGPLELLASFDQGWLVWGRPILGLLAGLALSGWIITSTAVLVVSASTVEVSRGGSVDRVIDREKIDAIRPRGSKLIIENASGRVLFNDDVEGDRAAIREAFLRHHYPWEGPRD